jgi:hypothetical protein
MDFWFDQAMKVLKKQTKWKRYSGSGSGLMPQTFSMISPVQDGVQLQ